MGSRHVMHARQVIAEDDVIGRLELEIFGYELFTRDYRP